jgi:WD40 repeat protein
MTTTNRQARLALLLVAATFAFAPSASQAFQVLVADRAAGGISNVYRYNSSGVSLGPVIDDPSSLSMLTGLALSPDSSTLYVSSSGTGEVVAYDYDVATGKATGGSVFASDLLAPSAIKFSKDGNTIFVSSNGGAGVYQFNAADGTPGANLLGGEFVVHAGLDFAPTGELLVVGFADMVGNGGVVKADLGLTSLSSFIPPNAGIEWASGIAVHEEDVYVVGLNNGSVLRFDVNTGVQDPAFAIDLTAFGFSLYPQDIKLDPTGDGLLVGILGQGPMGAPSSIAKYDFDGNFLGTFAAAGGGGFGEATAFITIIPEPASVVLLGGTLVGLVGWRLRRNASRKA